MARTSKVISVVLLLAQLGFFYMSLAHSHSLLFAFASLNIFVAVVRVLLAAGLVWLSFNTHRFSDKTREYFLSAGLAVIAFGLIAGLDTAMGSFLYGWVQPLDTMFLLEIGIILCAKSLPVTVFAKAKAKAKAQVKTSTRAKRLQPAWRTQLAKLPRPQLSIKVPRFTIF
ncbi:MAG TPA: hypothetical protein VFP35_02110 [Candidatus Saccharimonadales bacterium]|nr:hypothetical protein [Candidatus Saccharimonadales bacterium]